MNNFQNQHLKNQQNYQSQGQQQTDFNAQNQQPNQQANQQQPSGLMQTLIGAALPALIQHFTGQQMPLGGPSPEMQMVLGQVLSIQQQILTTQQSLSERLSSLESNASNQFANLTQEVKGIKSIRLTHERKQIELNGNDYQSPQHQES